MRAGKSAAARRSGHLRGQLSGAALPRSGRGPARFSKSFSKSAQGASTPLNEPPTFCYSLLTSGCRSGILRRLLPMRQIISRGVRWGCVLVLAGLGSVAAAQSLASVGMFENHQDIGEVLHAGASEFDAGAKSYTLSGSGDNMWAAKDAF